MSRLVATPEISERHRSCVVAKCFSDVTFPQEYCADRFACLVRAVTTGGRTWWAHFDFPRMNIAPALLRKRIEGDLNLRAFRLAQRSGEVAEGGPMLNSGGCAPDSHQLADQCVLGQDGPDGRLQQPRSTLRR